MEAFSGQVGWRKHRFLTIFLGFLVAVAPLKIHAEFAVNEVADAFFGPHLLHEGGDGLALGDAYGLQYQYLQVIQSQLGLRRGFKVAMTSASSQQRFGLTEPLFGQFLEQMLISSPAQLPVGFGAHGLVEADLLVRVADVGINAVTDIDDLLVHLDAVIPFVELPDPLWSGQLTAAKLVAVNCGARYGVLGEPITLDGDDDWHQRLAAFEVDLFDPNGKILGSGTGEDLLGHPLKVVFWLLQHLRERGDRLQPGDVISLGSLTRPLAPELGRYKAVYRDLDPSGPVSVTVDFVKNQQAVTP